jgi:hypothetical protein
MKTKVPFMLTATFGVKGDTPSRLCLIPGGQ